MSEILSSDPSLYCVSAWNDNGQFPFVFDNSIFFLLSLLIAMVLRTDHFMGVGWLIQANLWSSVRNFWNKQYWRDGMSSPLIRQGRSCLYPEVSRVYTFEESGINKKK